MASTVEINDAVFCAQHLKEVCENCELDNREDNDAFYGFESKERDELTADAKEGSDGAYVCNKHDEAACSQCFNWKKQIMRLKSLAARKGLT